MRNVKAWQLVALLCGVVTIWSAAERKQAAATIDKQAAAIATLERDIAAHIAADAKRSEQATNVAAADKKHTGELTDAKAETARLRACIADGSCGLRIRATCPTTPADVPGTPSASSVDDAGGARLTGDAGFAYYALRDTLNATQAKLKMCQAYAAAVSK